MYKEVLIVLAVVIVFFYFTKQMSLENFDVPNEAVGAISDMYNNKKVTTNDLEVTNGITTQNANVTGTLTGNIANFGTMSAQNFSFPNRCRQVTGQWQATGVGQGKGIQFLDRYFSQTSMCAPDEYLNWIWYENQDTSGNQARIHATCCAFK